MAQLAIQLAFTAIGGAFLPGIPALGITGAGIGSLVGSAVNSILFPPPDVHTRGPRLQEKAVTSSSYGKSIAIVYGTAPVDGNIIDASRIYGTSHKETQEAGKGGGQEVTHTSYTYSVDLAVALCDGPISGVLQIYANEKLIYDARPGSSLKKPSWLDVEIYTGTETQEPDATLESIHGAGEVPAYRGLAYVVFSRFQLDPFGRRVPNFRFIVVGNGTKTTNETVTDISPDGGTANGPFYLQSTGLIYASVNQGTYDERAMVAMDPYSKNIVWALDGRDVNGSGILIHNVDAPQECGDDANTYLISVGRSTTSGTSRRAMFVNAKTGVAVKVASIQSSTDAVMRLLSLFKNQISFLHPGGGITKNVKMHTFSSATWSSNYGTIDPPTGYDWDGNYVWACKQGELTLQGTLLLTTSPAIIAAVVKDGTDFSIALWTTLYMSSPTDHEPVYTVHDFGSTYSEIPQIKYDSERECFWAICEDTTTNDISLIKIPDDGTTPTEYSWNSLYSMNDNCATGTNNFPFAIEESTGHLWTEDGAGKWWRWDIVNLTAPVEYTASTIARNLVHLPVSDAMWGGVSDDIVEYQFDRLQSNTVSLSSIVDDVLDRVGLVAADYDTTDLDSVTVRGYVVNTQMSARAALNPLRQGFFFDHADTGSEIAFKTLGQSLTKSLAVDDIGAHAFGDEAPPLIEIDRVQEVDLPKELGVFYMDLGANYEIGYQRSRALATKSDQALSIEFPIVFSHDEARQRSEILLHLARIERESYKVQAMPVHYDLIPADVISVNDGVTDFRMRIQEKTSERGVLKLSCVRDEPAVLTSSSVGGEITDRDVSIDIQGIMQYELLDLPALRDDDMAAGFYLAGYSYTPTWGGGVLFRSSDEATWSEIVVVPFAATVGRVWNDPETATAERWDDLSELSMSIYTGELESKTRAEIIAGTVNAAAYGDTGRWEIVQFTTATLGADNLYTVSGLLRGRLGTDANVNTHERGDLFILLDTDTIRRIEAQQSEIGSTYYYRGVTLGRALYDEVNIDKSHTHIGPGLLCYSPAHFDYYKESDLDVVFTWDERTRQIWSNFWSGVSSDPGDYEIDILDGSTVTRTISVSAETATYSRTDQETDFGASTTDTITTRIYQVSSVGRGHYAELSVTLG